MIRLRWPVIAIVLIWTSLAVHSSDDFVEPDTNELVSEQPNLAAYTKQIIWTQMKEIAIQFKRKGYNHGYTRGYSENAEKSFHSYVECFMANGKRALEFYRTFSYQIETEKVQNEIRTKAVPVPTRIRVINQTYDLWMYKSKPGNRKKSKNGRNGRTTKVKPTKNTEDRKGPPIDKLTRYFRNWYYLVSEDGPDKPSFFQALRFKMDIYFKEHQARYNNDKTRFYEVLSAILARWFLLFCAYSHEVMKRIYDYGRDHSDLEYADAFLHEIPNWYIDDEQLDLLDIYQKLVHKNPFEINRLYIIRKGRTIILPYTYSDDCSKQSFFHTIPNPQLTPATIDYDDQNCT